MQNPDRRYFLASLPALTFAQGDGTRPNILVILTDNFNPKVTGFAGHPLVRTPNLDRLAKEGAWFPNCYAGSPVCAPARAGLMTGMFPSDVGSYCNATPLRKPVPTWGHRLRDVGYETQAFGKMDLNVRADLGFKQALTVHSHDEGPDITALFRRPMCYRIDERDEIRAKIVERPHKDVDVMNATVAFLRAQQSNTKPWAAYVGFTGPLPGFSVQRRYYDMYPADKIDLPNIPPGYIESMPEPWTVTRTFKRVVTPIPERRIREARAAYYGNVTAVDERIGAVIAEVDRLGLRKNTFVIVTADHGRSLGEHGMWYHNEPTDSSSRVPMIVLGPGIPAGRRIDTPVMHADLFPTFMDMAGTRTPDGLRGHSLLPMLQGKASGHPGVAYSECHAEGTCTGSFVIREGRWKYIHYTYYESLLFDMDKDPDEMHNVINTPEGKAASQELHKRLLSLVNPTERTEQAFQRQEEMLAELCARMSLQELLDFGFEQRLGRGQALTLLSKYKRT